MDDATSTHDDDDFAAALSVARGTASQELDLSDALVEPVTINEDVVGGHQPPGS